MAEASLVQYVSPPVHVVRRGWHEVASPTGDPVGRVYINALFDPVETSALPAAVPTPARSYTRVVEPESVATGLWGEMKQATAEIVESVSGCIMFTTHASRPLALNAVRNRVVSMYTCQMAGSPGTQAPARPIPAPTTLRECLPSSTLLGMLLGMCV